eukprot:jgi/Bigna1/69043/fgenesh1_pg.7_\
MAYSSNDISSCSMIVFCRDSVSKGILNAHVFQILMGVPGLLSWAFGNGRRSGEVDETWERRYLDMRRRKQGDVKEEEQEKIIVVDGYSTINYVFCNHLELITFDLRAFAERIRELVAAFRRCGYTLVCFFDGIVDSEKKPMWLQRRARVANQVNEVNRVCCNRSGALWKTTELARAVGSWPLTADAVRLLPQAFQRAGCEVIFCKEEVVFEFTLSFLCPLLGRCGSPTKLLQADRCIVQYALDVEASAVLSADSVDMLIFPVNVFLNIQTLIPLLPTYFQISKHGLRCRCVRRTKLMSRTKIRKYSEWTKLPLWLGNDVFPTRTKLHAGKAIKALSQGHKPPGANSPELIKQVQRYYAVDQRKMKKQPQKGESDETKQAWLCKYSVQLAHGFFGVGPKKKKKPPQKGGGGGTHPASVGKFSVPLAQGQFFGEPLLECVGVKNDPRFHPLHEAFRGLRRHICAEMKHVSTVSEYLCSATIDPNEWREQLLEVRQEDPPPFMLPNLPPPARKKIRERAKSSPDAALSIVEFTQIILNLSAVQCSTTKRQRDSLMRQASERGKHQLPNLHDIELSIADLHARSVFLEGAALLRARDNYLASKLKAAEIPAKLDSTSTIHEKGDNDNKKDDDGRVASMKRNAGAGQKNDSSCNVARKYPFVFEFFDGPLYHYLCSVHSRRE